MKQDEGGRVFVPAGRQIELVQGFERSGLSAPRFASMSGVAAKARYGASRAAAVGLGDSGKSRMAGYAVRIGAAFGGPRGCGLGEVG